MKPLARHLQDRVIPGYQLEVSLGPEVQAVKLILFRGKVKS